MVVECLPGKNKTWVSLPAMQKNKTKNKPIALDQGSCHSPSLLVPRWWGRSPKGQSKCSQMSVGYGSCGKLTGHLQPLQEELGDNWPHPLRVWSVVVQESSFPSQAQWHTPIIPAALQAETGGLGVQCQPQQNRGIKQLSETLSSNKYKVGLRMWLNDQVPLSSIPSMQPNKIKERSFLQITLTCPAPSVHRRKPVSFSCMYLDHPAQPALSVPLTWLGLGAFRDLEFY